MNSSIGLDIGGAHLKACLIKNNKTLKLSKADLFKTLYGNHKTLLSTLRELKRSGPWEKIFR